MRTSRPERARGPACVLTPPFHFRRGSSQRSLEIAQEIADDLCAALARSKTSWATSRAPLLRRQSGRARRVARVVHEAPGLQLPRDEGEPAGSLDAVAR